MSGYQSLKALYTLCHYHSALFNTHLSTHKFSSVIAISIVGNVHCTSCAHLCVWYMYFLQCGNLDYLLYLLMGTCLPYGVQTKILKHFKITIMGTVRQAVVEIHVRVRFQETNISQCNGFWNDGKMAKCVCVCECVCPTGLKGLQGKSTVFHYVQKERAGSSLFSRALRKERTSHPLWGLSESLFSFLPQASLCAIYYKTHLAQMKETLLNGCVFCVWKRGVIYSSAFTTFMTDKSTAVA